MRARGWKKKEDMWAGWKEVWLECDGCGMFVCARVRGLGCRECRCLYVWCLFDKKDGKS